MLVAQGFIGVFHEKLLTIAQRYIAREAVGRTFSFRPDWFQERVPMFFAHYRITNIAFWLPLSVLLGAAVAWRTYRRRWVSQAALSAILVLLTILDLTVLGRQLVPQCDLKRYPLWPKTAVLNCFEKERDLVPRVSMEPERDSQYLAHFPCELVDGVWSAEFGWNFFIGARDSTANALSLRWQKQRAVESRKCKIRYSAKPTASHLRGD